MDKHAVVSRDIVFLDELDDEDMQLYIKELRLAGEDAVMERHGWFVWVWNKKKDRGGLRGTPLKTWYKQGGDKKWRKQK